MGDSQHHYVQSSEASPDTEQLHTFYARLNRTDPLGGLDPDKHQLRPCSNQCGRVEGHFHTFKVIYKAIPGTVRPP